MSTLSNEEIQQLSFQQLRNECKKADLSAGGSTQVLRKRLQDWLVQQSNQGGKRGREADDDDDDEVVVVEGAPNNKRPKKSPADDLICPITLELTWEPVSAEDGRVYEKEAIEQHIKTQRENGATLKSPVTNEPMGERLLPLRQQRSLIETLIETGAIQGDLAASWNNKVEQAKAMEALQQKANAGDIKAIYALGTCYRKGSDGFQKNMELSYQWFKKGHDGGCFKSTSLLGDIFLCGSGVPTCKHQGMMYTALAAAQGSNFGAYWLGKLLSTGKYGFPQDKKEAIRWLKRALSPDCPLRHMSKATKGKAKTLLESLLNENVVGAAANTEGTTEN